jgi:hypothetical protein
MPTISTNQWSLGKISQRIRIYKHTKNIFDPIKTIDKTIDNTICSVCGDYSQSELHNANAILLNCMDFRLRDNVTCHLNLKGYKNSYDEVISAGASLGYNGLSKYRGWDIFIDDHIVLAYELHDISKILIVEHEKCGGYKAHYGDMTYEQEKQHHLENSTTCADTLWSKFNGVDGSVKKIDNLIIIVYIISIDGCSFTELYRRE